MAIDYSDLLDPSKFLTSKSFSSQYGLSKAHRFALQFAMGNVEKNFSALSILNPINDFVYDAIEVSVPGITMAVSGSIIDQRPRYHGTERSDQDLSITFIESADMPYRKFFSSWINMIWDPRTKTRNYPADYTADEIRVWVLDNEAKGAICDIFKDVFPFEINDLDFNVSKYDTMTTTVKFKIGLHDVTDETKYDFEK